MINKLKYAVVFIILSAISACVTQNPQRRTKTTASEYNPLSYVLHPKFKVFHVSDTETRIYIKIFTKELRYSSANAERINKSVIKAECKIKPSVKSNIILDSIKTTFTAVKKENQTSIITFLKLKKYNAENYIAVISLTDIYGNKTSRSYVRINKNNDGNEQNYISYKAKNMKPVFNEYFASGDSLIIKYNDPTVKRMKISRTCINLPYAEVPYKKNTKDSVFNFSPDTVWEVKSKFGKIPFKANKKGIYLIKADTSKEKGMLKVNFGKIYPVLTRSEELLDALKYLLSDEEFDKMKNSENKKLAVDNFWIKAAGNKERARDILKVWYNRAIYANYYFVSYKEGRKTDRGMIYMLFGPPDSIENFDDAEKWIYYNTKEDKKIEFIFVIPEKSISKNNFVLLRDGKYATEWNKAVKSWRAGIIYRY